MSLDLSTKDTTPRQERAYEGWYAIVPGDLPMLSAPGPDGRPIADADAEDAALADLEIALAKHILAARERFIEVRAERTRREDARQQAIDAERRRIRAWADEVQANVNRARGVA